MLKRNSPVYSEMISLESKTNCLCGELPIVSGNGIIGWGNC